VITESDARRVAEAELATFGGDRRVITRVIEEERGWQFNWNSAAYVETGDTRDRLVGNVPILVSREDGSIISQPPPKWDRTERPTAVVLNRTSEGWWYFKYMSGERATIGGRLRQQGLTEEEAKACVLRGPPSVYLGGAEIEGDWKADEPDSWYADLKVLDPNP
jgi:hypothetical protein